jgi:hypothetical protein
MSALLASPPKIAMTRRTNLWTYFYNRYGDLNQPENLERCLAVMARYKRLKVIQIDPERLRRDFVQGEKTYGRLFALIETHFAERQGKPRWGDKSLNTERYTDAIFTAFPDARIIHMMRDPRDRYASSRTRWQDMLGRAGAGTSMWLASANLAKKNQQRYPDRYMVLRYESLVTEPEQTLRSICTFIDEEYSSEMLTMHGAPRLLEKGSNSSYGRREPGRISADSLGRYRQVLTQQEIAFIQAFAGNDMRTFAYPLDEIHFSLKDRLSYMFLDWPISLLLMAGWTGKEIFENTRGRTVPARRLITEEGKPTNVPV